MNQQHLKSYFPQKRKKDMYESFKKEKYIIDAESSDLVSKARIWEMIEKKQSEEKQKAELDKRDKDNRDFIKRTVEKGFSNGSHDDDEIQAKTMQGSDEQALTLEGKDRMNNEALCNLIHHLSSEINELKKAISALPLPAKK